MKKIILLVTFVSTVFGFSSCETEDSLDPRPVIVSGQYVRLDITKRMLSIDHMDETQFGGKLTAPSGNVKKYVLKVRRRNEFAVTTGNYVDIVTVNTFPYELVLTPQKIADALGIPVTDLKKGDFYQFLGTAYGFDGTVTNYTNLSSTVKTQKGMKQAFRFLTTLSDDAGIAFTEREGNIFDNYQNL